ncbi:hypothetical protein [Lederbergia citrea]|uniref:hypothetical protein n=1 Tax=Lederbergia citrea TaxID=2833581 RepID=UPI001BC915E4|nr:hypothetical protein [Lederbergia citrea]MBS4202739.1 hypothetical protein [Lederbergia citrea]
MKRKINQFTFQNWMKNFKGICRQLIIPFTVFQAIRTFIFPTTLDVLLLTLFIILALAFHYDWI